MLLCVDPAEGALTETVQCLDGGHGSVEGVATAAEARDVSSAHDHVDALVTEYDLPDGTGLELIDAVRRDHPDVFCLLFTATPLDAIETSESDTVVDYLSKEDPEKWTALTARVEGALDRGLQTSYPLPDSEAARLTALDSYSVEPDSLGESFDRLTELATALFDVNASAVGLIDRHEQRFLACHGLEFDPIDRSDTICTYAILDGDVTVIEDTADDPRFQENTELAEAGIRFYASAPLITRDGNAIGTFCIYDDTPREVSKRDRQLLTLLADDVMDHLELHRELQDETGADADE